MKKVFITIILLLATFRSFAATEIILSKNIKPDISKLMSQDLKILDNFPFRDDPDKKTLEILGIDSLTTQTANHWLNERVKYIIEENAFTTLIAKIKSNPYIDQENVDFPSPLPLDLNTNQKNNKNTSITMTNTGAAYYIQGKNEHRIYGIKISPIETKNIRVRVTSPRVGILQIGAGLFDPTLAVNRLNSAAFSNSIFRLSFLFHEARHSDGHGISLGFTHSICPKGHDYEGEAACDENLNGAYSTGAVMAREMMIACKEKCSERDKEMLKIFILDNYNRIQIPHQKIDQNKLYWDATPEEF